MERIFRVMQCSEREKVLLATFQLDRDARAWWETASRQLPNINIEWDEILELFNTKYFSKGNHEKKELLMDTNMRPTQRLVRACQQAAQLLEEALEATKEIKEVTNKNGKRKYHDDKKATQQTKCNNEISRIICLHCHKPGHVDKECWQKIGACLRCGNTRHQLRECPLLEESATSVKDLNSMTKGKRLNNGKGKKNNKNDRRLTLNHEGRCKNCNKACHMSKDCWKNQGKCFRCGSSDHKIRNCPKKDKHYGKSTHQDTLEALAMPSPNDEVRTMEEGDNFMVAFTFRRRQAMRRVLPVSA
ncbi:hypothetical protein Taro_000608 [Colocasia esculenta]|uniref:CCHC-type domain-containing protein n=1 Tax=Colocasia esculenta TaxID=4460 RepID=A0A843TDN3_COLES|nr:hypothetical protein [Colocasia esculenta]